MVHTTTWTPDRIERVLELRRQGVKWPRVDQLMQVRAHRSREALRRHYIPDPGRALPKSPAPETPQRSHKAPPELADRPRKVPLPAGHEITWSAITERTMLDGRSFRP